MKRVVLLVLEDDPGESLLIKKAVSDMGDISLQMAANGVILLNLIKRMPATPDLVILDIMCPQKTGLQVLEELRADPKYDATPIVMFSTSDSEFHMRTAKNLGADAYELKPRSSGGTSPDKQMGQVILGIIDKFKDGRSNAPAKASPKKSTLPKMEWPTL